MISEKNGSFSMLIFNMSDAGFFSLPLQPLHKFLKKYICSVGKFTINVFHCINFK